MVDKGKIMLEGLWQWQEMPAGSSSTRRGLNLPWMDKGCRWHSTGQHGTAWWSHWECGACPGYLSCGSLALNFSGLLVKISAACWPPMPAIHYKEMKVFKSFSLLPFCEQSPQKHPSAFGCVWLYCLLPVSVLHHAKDLTLNEDRNPLFTLHTCQGQGKRQLK